MSENVLKFPQLRAAPIEEAVIDFRVQLSQELNPESLKSFKDFFEDKFNVKAQNNKISTAFQLKDNEASLPQVVNNLTGYTFESNDKEYVVKVNLDGLTVGRVRSYTSWDDLINEVSQIWDCYAKLVGDFVVTRSAVRYINKIVLPGPYLDFDDYLTAAPRVPHGLPQAMSEFISRTVTPIDENSGVIFTQAFQAGVIPNKEVTVILDIDVFSEQEFDSTDSVKNEILKKLRLAKNQTFFSSITEKTLELYL
jgi:uncharacterized protein (TIGR04255 family)